MVEAQQARMTELGEIGLIDIASDANRMIMRRTIERMIAEEQGVPVAEYFAPGRHADQPFVQRNPATRQSPRCTN
jgi:hypothetical protein